MRVATKVATGSGLLAALLIGVLTYFVVVVRQLVTANQELTAVHFQASTLALDLLNQLDQLDTNARKFAVTRDEAYALRVSKARDAFTAGLKELETLDARAGGSLETSRLASEWRAFPLAGVDAVEVATRLAGIADAQTPQVLADPIERLHRKTWGVLELTRNGIASQVARSAEAGRNAERLSLFVAGLALLLALLIVVLTVRSINEPLKRLTEGTRAVADGTFSYQLDDGAGDEFAELAGDFNTMVRRLGELDEMKRGFVSRVSHELKTPLVAMQETNHLLLDGLPGPLTDRQRRLLELHLQGSRRLSAMIANLLDLARVEAGVMKYDMRDHDLAALARAAAAELEVWAHEHGISFELDLPATPLTVECDADRITQVLVNLFDNAVKFSPRGQVVSLGGRLLPAPPADAPPEIAATLARPRTARYVEVRVSDHGPGIPAREKRLVFERFHQAHGESRRSGTGVGLGLAICREIARAHVGVVWAVDNRPSGSVFVLLLPQTQPHGDSGGSDRPVAKETTA